MIALFSSDFVPRYKEDAILTLCYPSQHVIVLRYRAGLVDNTIREWKVGSDENVHIPVFFSRKAILIYAETSGADFLFYPFRFVRLEHCWKRGEIYFLAVSLQKYVDYGTSDMVGKLNELRNAIISTPTRPYPPQPQHKLETTELDSATTRANRPFAPALGLYAYSMGKQESGIIGACRTKRNDDATWQSVVHIAQQSPDLQKHLFYRIRGLYTLKKSFLPRRRFTETPITPRTLVAESLYPLPIGDLIVMKVDSFRPSYATPFEPIRLKINPYGDNLIGVGHQEFQVHSRYNEERIILACKRVLEDTLTPITVLGAQVTSGSSSTTNTTPASTSQDVTPRERPVVPEARFLAQVTVSRAVIFVILAGLVLVPLLVGSDAASVQAFAKILSVKAPNLGAVLADAEVAKSIARLLKWTGASITLLVGYLAYRKIPLGK